MPWRLAASTSLSTFPRRLDQRWHLHRLAPPAPAIDGSKSIPRANWPRSQLPAGPAFERSISLLGVETVRQDDGDILVDHLGSSLQDDSRVPNRVTGGPPTCRAQVAHFVRSPSTQGQPAPCRSLRPSSEAARPPCRRRSSGLSRAENRRGEEHQQHDDRGRVVGQQIVAARRSALTMQRHTQRHRRDPTPPHQQQRQRFARELDQRDSWRESRAHEGGLLSSPHEFTSRRSSTRPACADTTFHVFWIFIHATLSRATRTWPDPSRSSRSARWQGTAGWSFLAFRPGRRHPSPWPNTTIVSRGWTTFVGGHALNDSRHQAIAATTPARSAPKPRQFAHFIGLDRTLGAAAPIICRHASRGPSTCEQVPRGQAGADRAIATFDFRRVHARRRIVWMADTVSPG